MSAEDNADFPCSEKVMIGSLLDSRRNIFPESLASDFGDSLLCDVDDNDSCLCCDKPSAGFGSVFSFSLPTAFAADDSRLFWLIKLHFGLSSGADKLAVGTETPEDKGTSDAKGTSEHRVPSEGKGTSEHKGNSEDKGNSDDMGTADGKDTSDEKGISEDKGTSEDMSTSEDKFTSKCTSEDTETSVFEAWTLKPKGRGATDAGLKPSDNSGFGTGC